MHDYTAAPAVELLATHCCLCNRPLLDADSVERGIGPTCARKAGVDDVAHAPDWTRVRAILTPLDVTVPDDARRAANALVHRVGRDPHGADVPRYVEAIEALGYLRLAATLAEHLVPARAHVAREGDRLVVSAEVPATHFDGLVVALRAVPGRRWDRDRKVNVVPVASKRALWEALTRALPRGALVIGDRVCSVA